MPDILQAAAIAYNHRSSIKRFLKWLLILSCVFAFFVYMVVATVIAAIEGSIRPPKPAVVTTSSPSKAAPPPSKAKH